MTRKREGIAMQEQFKAMKKVIEPESYWFLISMKWIKSWEKYVYMDEINDPEKEPDPDLVRRHPGPINCSDIISSEEALIDRTKEDAWMNV